VDEPTSSQRATRRRTCRRVLTTGSLEEAEKGALRPILGNAARELLKAIDAEGLRRTSSYFAFTATPKHKTLEVFGTEGLDGKPRPFHLYSMRQAIEEGFIWTCSGTTPPTRPTTLAIR